MEDDHEAEEEPPQRRTSYPRYKNKPNKMTHGKGQSGTAQGWLPGSGHEALPLSMRWTFLTDADLAAPGPEWRLRLVKESAENYQCTTSWRKDPNSERNMIIPIQGQRPR